MTVTGGCVDGVCCFKLIITLLGTHGDERTVLYKTKSLDGTKPNTNPKTKTKTNPNPKLMKILTLFICFKLFSSTTP